MGHIEGGLVYRLPWALDAIRVRAAAHGDTIDGLPMTDFELGYAVAAVETGTLNRTASILIQAGFNSRLAAIKAVVDTIATFENGQQLRGARSSIATGRQNRHLISWTRRFVRDCGCLDGEQ